MSVFLKHYKKLNLSQKKAVDSLDGPILVAAGPGTGKTEILALRIANLIRRKKAKPEEILALTFSNSAVASMRKRTVQFLGLQAYNIEIKTFHGFCNEVINDYPEKFTSFKNLEHLDELESLKIIKGILKRKSFKQIKPFYNPYLYQKEILSTLGELKREGVSPEELREALKKEKEKLISSKKINSKTGKPIGKWQAAFKRWERLKDLLEIYKEYLAKGAEKDRYDFSDMIIWVTEQFKKDYELKSSYRDRFKYILSDEYQDTNIPQNEVIEILGKPAQKPNIFVVGDDDQSIYRFQGASLDNIISFEKKHPEAKIIPLNINYRSQQKIVAGAKSLIEKNKERLANFTHQQLDKNIKSFAEKSKKGEITLYEFHDELVENYFISQKIKELHKKGIPFKEMAIINRTNKDISQIADYLIKAGIPVETSNANSILDEKEIRDILSILSAVVNPQDNIAIYEAMSVGIWKIDSIDFLKFTVQASRARKKYIDFWEQKNIEKGKEKIAWKDFKKIDIFFQKIIQWHKESIHSPAILVLEKIINEAGLIEACLKEKNIRELNRIFSLFSFVKKNNRKNISLKLKVLLKDLKIMQEDELSIKEKTLSMAEDDVQVITAHAAKGLEFEVVFIPRLYQGNWSGKREHNTLKIPWESLSLSKRNRNESVKDDDERRSFFVAMTRAKSQLFLSRADYYDFADSFADSSIKAPSRLLEEIEENFFERGKTEKYEDTSLERIKIELKEKPIINSKKSLEQENNFLSQQVENLVLSPTSLNLYLHCPLKYKYEKLLMIPSAKNKTASLGTSIHAALERFFRDFKEGKPVGKSSLLTFFKEAIAQEIFTADELKDALREGKKMLGNYFQEYNKSFVKPLALEMDFEKVYLQKIPTLDVGSVMLTGKIDKIEALNQKIKNKKIKTPVKVIDYKTGKSQTRNEILGKTKNSSGDIYRQLVFYKLLSLLDKKFPYSVEEAEVDFVKSENGRFRKESFPITKEETAKLKEEIELVAQKIKKLDFKPTQDKRKCQRCDFKNICSRF
jgi:DNA helicase II / ATP-dependent DNA helicase PcrA